LNPPGVPVDPVEVTITGTNATYGWGPRPVGTENHTYSTKLVLGFDVWTNETIRIIARDPNSPIIDVVDYKFTTIPHVTTVDLVLDIYYMDLYKFPGYLTDENYRAEAEYTGAATAQMALNYLHWDNYPNGNPPMTYDNQTTILNDAKALNDDGGSAYIDSGGMMLYMLQETGQFGYHWLRTAQSDKDIFLLQMFCYMDLDVAQTPGHPDHAPVLAPAYGSYAHWMAVRGAHTNKSSAPFPNGIPQFVGIEGFWVNDPHSEGLGMNVYVKADYLADNIFIPISKPGDYADGTRCLVGEPPEDAPPFDSDTTVEILPAERQFSRAEKRAMRMASRGMFISDFAESVAISAAYDNANEICAIAGVTLSEDGRVTFNRDGSSVVTFGDIEVHQGGFGELQMITGL
jgi:hypothetical protein